MDILLIGYLVKYHDRYKIPILNLLCRLEFSEFMRLPYCFSMILVNTDLTVQVISTVCRFKSLF